MAKFKSDTERILEAISNHGSGFGDFCREFVDTPERGDKDGWARLFRKLEIEIGAGNIEVGRGGDRRIESLRLTEQGVARLYELQQRAF